jgi:hypothetical protein
MRDVLAESITATLSVHLGPNVSRMAIRSFAKKVGLSGPEQISPTHIPALIEELRPMLNVMVGRGPSEAVMTEISRRAAR